MIQESPGCIFVDLLGNALALLCRTHLTTLSEGFAAAGDLAGAGDFPAAGDLADTAQHDIRFIVDTISGHVVPISVYPDHGCRSRYRDIPYIGYT